MRFNDAQLQQPIDIERFREAMTRFPSGVTIVTTTDSTGKPRGFTATSFCSLSAEPALVLVCVANTAECHEVFLSADRWNVHFVAPGQTDLAIRFATRGADKFGGGVAKTDALGQPHILDSSVTLRCAAFSKHPGGDHTILIGRVDDVEFGNDEPTVYHMREFRSLSQAS
ncbi:flavin reductase [Rhodococcus sp. ABRD24]|uniref:flavin reductase family protein n=1 Tax=Rhodococcus sp. ABRD24 TaxID=2507582 RepID=UPI00103CE7D4|nr:flavin reductase family protein [Rhodococcus sp. ABRD24]QBJ97749.1 flavin reductase [Rhodococcus sp. ABRD24]